MYGPFFDDDREAYACVSSQTRATHALNVAFATNGACQQPGGFDTHLTHTEITCRANNPVDENIDL